ncbi:DUF222 domain-containing protein [Nocardia sp. NPDC006630]|uniref:HNH endonuclease signature motif containing protein n=1 Tax=Nocardia sp. NPDC006630 TaxID=3157181 RepID=UPI0033BC8B18
MNPGGETTIVSSAHALDTAVENLLDASLTPLLDEEFIALMREVETSMRKLEAVKHRFVTETCTRSLAARAGSASPIKFLEQTLRLSHADAASRVNAAKQLSPQPALGGELEPELAYVAEAQRAGDISVDHVRRIAQVLKRIPCAADPGQKDLAQDVLTTYARTGSPDKLVDLGEVILANIDPDGTLTQDKDRERMRGLTLGRKRADGMSPLIGEITEPLREVLEPLLAKFARPGMCNPADPDSPKVADRTLDRTKLKAAAERDTRSAAQRNHDALLAVLRFQLDRPKLGSHRGLPVEAIIVMRVEDLERGTGIATTATGGTLTIPQALELAAGTRPLLVVLNKAGLPLYLGRGRDRLATPAQRLALIASDKGCTRPGCSAPASVSAAHHVTGWAEGGPTDIDNLTLACDGCHAMIHDGPGGWKTIVMGEDTDFPGRTGWIAPPHIDPTGTPQVNHLHHTGELMAGALSEIRARERLQRERRRVWLDARKTTPTRE